MSRKTVITHRADSDGILLRDRLAADALALALAHALGNLPGKASLDLQIYTGW